MDVCVDEQRDGNTICGVGRGEAIFEVVVADG